MDSPSDAFKEVFYEYGAKLSPGLMRLQLEGELEFEADGPSGEHTDENAATPTKVVDTESSDEAEEEAFLASHRHM